MNKYAQSQVPAAAAAVVTMVTHQVVHQIVMVMMMINLSQRNLVTLATPTLQHKQTCNDTLQYNII